MIVIPEGDIVQRDDRINTTWKTHIDSFLLAKYPVTVDLYFAVTRKESYSVAGDQRPVINVSWNDAVLFCNLLSRVAGLKECYSILSDEGDVVCDWSAGGYRLPTEAEWQFACQAGTSWYRYGEIDKIAWYHGNSGDEIREVGLKEPS